MSTIHPTAMVDEKARIGQNVSIGPFAVIEQDVVIGDDSVIGPQAYIANGARVGNSCQIHKGAVVSSLPQDLKFGGEKTTLEIGDHTVVREFCTLNRGTLAHGKSVIGKHCLLMAYAHVAHDCIVGDHVILANGVQLGGHVEIHDYAIIGGMTPVHQFCKVGAHAMVGGGYRVVQDVPPFITCSGEPLRYAGVNSVGLKRRGFDAEVINNLKRAYRLIYRAQLNRRQALEKIRNELTQDEHIQALLHFIENSERGLV